MRAVQALALVVLSLAAPVFADESKETTADGVAVRFFAPEIGGVLRPHFITHRILSFEARIVARLEGDSGKVVEERHVRAAVDRHIAESILAELPPDRPMARADVLRFSSDFRRALELKLGGEEVLAEFAARDGLVTSELSAIFERRAQAALYADHALLPLFSPSEVQLRDAFRGGQSFFRGARYEDVRPDLVRWTMDERLRTVEVAFLQTARTRITVIASK